VLIYHCVTGLVCCCQFNSSDIFTEYNLNYILLSIIYSDQITSCIKTNCRFPFSVKSMSTVNGVDTDTSRPGNSDLRSLSTRLSILLLINTCSSVIEYLDMKPSMILHGGTNIVVVTEVDVVGVTGIVIKGVVVIMLVVVCGTELVFGVVVVPIDVVFKTVAVVIGIIVVVGLTVVFTVVNVVVGGTPVVVVEGFVV